MENVLFIAPYYPPIGGPGVHRTAHFVKYLRKFNYNPIILTISKIDVKEGKYPLDNSYKSLENNYRVFRTPTKEPRMIRKILIRLKIFRVFWYLFYPVFWCESALWPFISFRFSIQIIKEYNIRKIYSTSGPFSSLLLGYLIRRKTNTKWAADFRDPFTDAYLWQFPSKLHWILMRQLENFLWSKIDHIIVTAPELKKLYVERRKKNQNKITVITNGFE